jgi:hypothetical protein
VPDDPMKNRVIRVDDTTWEAAQAAAKLKDEPLSAAIRRFLKGYAKR